MTKSIHEINDSFGAEVAGVINEGNAKLDEIRAKPDFEYSSSVPHYVQEDPALRHKLITQAREADETAVKERAKEKAEATLRRYPGEVAKRREKLRDEVLKPLADASPDLLARASMATEDELEGLLSTGITTSNQTLLNAVFVEALRRDLPHLRRRVAAEVGGVFGEWEATPSEQEVEDKVRQQRFMLEQALDQPVRVNAY